MVGQSQETVQRLSGMSMETEGFFWQKLISAVPWDDLVINYSWNIKQPGRINGLSNEMVIWYFTVYKKKSYRFVRFYDWLSKLDSGAKMQIHNETV